MTTRWRRQCDFHFVWLTANLRLSKLQRTILGDSMAQQTKARSKSKKRVRYAVVGLGDLAQVAILPAFQHSANSELVAIVSGDEEKRKKIARHYKLKQAYSYDEYDQALSAVDAVTSFFQTICIASTQSKPLLLAYTCSARNPWL